LTLEEKVRNILSQRKKNPLIDEKRGLAAVLILLYRKEGEYYILFTKRTELVEYHKGQISFPGGARDEEDRDLSTTAIRESGEEIGIKAGDVEILGELDDVFTVTSNFVITPFVATIPYPYKFEINPFEVEELVEVPISVLLDRNNLREEVYLYEGKPLSVYYFQYKDRVIWGATARILKQFLDLVSE